MTDYIDRQAAIDAIGSYILSFTAIDRNYYEGLRDAKRLLNDIPSAEVEPVCEMSGIKTNTLQGCPLAAIPKPIIEKLMLIYESARISGFIEKPWAWSLYQTWKWCDKAEEGWHRDGSNENSNHMAQKRV